MTEVDVGPQVVSEQVLLQELEAHYLSMPPVAVMKPEFRGFDGHCLRLRAPLSLHVNDKECAFGGSLVSLMTLSAWGLVTMQVRKAGLDADVFVADSQVRYLAPLFSDLEASARLAEDHEWDTFLATLRSKGRARASVVAEVRLPDGGLATDFRGRYAAILKR